ncbi:D-alanyl-D-alanine carboxypeptidase/D-alanyl-D-alanine-endopeptidase [Deinococcus sp.]|uniref:D-alanyl-D-alanine carboxypeptidase/D-alanyl-D-alanine-endopeptidase n=1 Tax=Deinococcus sp. TaxID=47478 RepID=UPI003C7AE36C
MTPHPAKLLLLMALVTVAGPLAAGQKASAPARGITLPALPGKPVAGLSAAQRAGMEAALKRVRGFRAGLIVTDAGSGRTLYSRFADTPFIPASNMKLLSLSTAVYTLGPDYWFSTSVTRPAGKQTASAAHLTLVGGGDPSLGQTATHSLAGLAHQVYASGIRRVGGLRLDPRLIGGAAGQGQAGWSVPVAERPVSGLTLNDPSAGDGAELTTAPDTRAALKRLGQAFRAALEGAGIRVGPGLEMATAPVSEQGALRPEEGIATTRSAPLAELTRTALKRSDNVWTEQLYARVGVDTGTPLWRPASLAHARARELALLARAGAGRAGLVIADGSGLSRRDRLTPRALSLLLRYVYLHPPVSALNSQALTPEAAFAARKNLLIEALPRAGTGTASPAATRLGGTLATRLTGLDVRAKTGTLPGVSALSGYLVTQSGRVLIFSVLMDGYGGPARHLRQLQDALLRALAADR